jgi:imidazolonepropionase
MSSFAISNIKLLAGINNTLSPLKGSALAQLQSLEDAYIIVEGEEIAVFGRMNDIVSGKTVLPQNNIDATGKIVLPAWCDSHTHIVYAGSREAEFVDKIKGVSYAEIAAKGGGILMSAKQLAESSDDELFLTAHQRITGALNMGTANLEIKSGYGLTLEQELRILRVIKKLKEKSRSGIRSTFLGAHAFPAEYRNNREGYVDLLIEQMIPAVAREQLADYIDVFCEKGFFDLQQTESICRAAIAQGMKVKLHANQLSSSGAVQLGVKLGAISVDHLEMMDEEAIVSLSHSATIGTMLPTAALFLRAPYPPAREMIDQGCAVALASDCNPGSSPGYNMNFVISLACICMKMLPEEAINAATINGAFAMGLQHQTGSIAVGKKADLIITKPIPSIAFLPYSFSSVHVEHTIVKGQIT